MYTDDYFVKLYDIHKLLTNLNYKSIIGSKSNEDSISQKLVYYNPNNITEKFTININNKYNISIKVPVKNTNYIYETTVSNIEEAYKYIKLHI